MKDLWNKIRKIKVSNAVYEISGLVKNKQIISAPQDIANTFAEVFEQALCNNMYDNDFLQYKQNIEKEIIQNDAVNLPLINQELNEMLKELKNNSSQGPDNITYEMIKNPPEVTLEYLLHIYNNIWANNIYPDKWREVTVLPIHKTNKGKTNPSHYRPIALANTMSKVLEKIINKRLIWHLEKHNLLHNQQCGFRKSRSTLDHIVTLISEVLSTFKNKQHLIAVTFDLEKAYDTCWKHYILKSLKEHKIGGNMFNYTKNFLSKRRFQVRFNNCLSDWKCQENGVPQGSPYRLRYKIV